MKMSATNIPADEVDRWWIVCPCCHQPGRVTRYEVNQVSTRSMLPQDTGKVRYIIRIALARILSYPSRDMPFGIVERIHEFEFERKAADPPTFVWSDDLRDFKTKRIRLSDPPPRIGPAFHYYDNVGSWEDGEEE